MTANAKRTTVLTLVISLVLAAVLFFVALTYCGETIDQIAAFVDGQYHASAASAFAASDERTKLPQNCVQHDSEMVTVTVLPPLTEARAKAAMAAACAANRLQDDVCEAAGTALRQRVAAAAAAAPDPVGATSARDSIGRGHSNRKCVAGNNEEEETCTGGADHTEASAANAHTDAAAADAVDKRLVMPFRVEHSVQQGISVNGDTHHVRITPSTDVTELARDTCAQHALASKECARLVTALQDKQYEAFCTPAPSSSAGLASGASEQLAVEGSW
eukprot:g414.t1